MHTYQIRESGRNARSTEEMIVGIVVLVLLIACGLADVSMPSRAPSSESPLSFYRERLHAAQVDQLQTRDATIESEVRKLSKALEGAKTDLASLRQVHDTLITQVVAATSRVKELEDKLLDSKAQAGKLKEYAAAQERLQKERDEAVGQAREAAERIRELTLKLQRAGVYP